MIRRCLPSNANAGCGMRTGSRAFGPRRRYAGFLVTRTRESSRSCGGQKNMLWRLRYAARGVVRPKATARARSRMRRHPRLSRHRGTPRRVPALRHGEARAPGVSGRQPALHQALCFLRRTPLSQSHDQGCGQGTQARLAHGQGIGEAVHA